MIEPAGCLFFKTNRQRDEWYSDEMPGDLKALTNELALARFRAFDALTTVTEIHRTSGENLAIGATSQSHVEWRAIDLRVDYLRLDTEESIRRRFNETWPTGLEPRMPRIPPLKHGTAPHFHLQLTTVEKKGGATLLKNSPATSYNSSQERKHR